MEARPDIRVGRLVVSVGHGGGRAIPACETARESTRADRRRACLHRLARAQEFAEHQSTHT